MWPAARASCDEPALRRAEPTVSRARSGTCAVGFTGRGRSLPVLSGVSSHLLTHFPWCLALPGDQGGRAPGHSSCDPDAKFG